MSVVLRSANTGRRIFLGSRFDAAGGREEHGPPFANLVRFEDSGYPSSRRADGLGAIRVTDSRRSIRPQRMPRLVRLNLRVGGTVAFGGCGSATTTRMRDDMTGGLCGT